MNLNIDKLENDIYNIYLHHIHLFILLMTDILKFISKNNSMNYLYI